jgi:hypothetical protein
MPAHAHGSERFRETTGRGLLAIAFLLAGILGACASNAPTWIGASLDAFDGAYDDSLLVWTPDLPPGVAGKEYRFALNARGHPKPFRWKLVSGQLPGGVALDGEGVLQGTPTQAGVSSFVVKVACTPVVSRRSPGQSPHVDWRMRSYSLIVKEGPAGVAGSSPGAAKAEARRKP